jgi:hypothetical protein
MDETQCHRGVTNILEVSWLKIWMIKNFRNIMRRKTLYIRKILRMKLKCLLPIIQLRGNRTGRVLWIHRQTTRRCWLKIIVHLRYRNLLCQGICKFLIVFRIRRHSPIMFRRPMIDISWKLEAVLEVKINVEMKMLKWKVNHIITVTKSKWTNPWTKTLSKESNKT